MERIETSSYLEILQGKNSYYARKETSIRATVEANIAEL